MNRTLALINVFILLVLAADDFLLPASHVREIYMEGRFSGTALLLVLLFFVFYR